MTERTIWKSQLGFLMAAIGSAVGLGNIWRFSYMSYEYGGAAFLIPYIIALILTGIPIMLLEYALGHSQQGSSPLALARVSRKYEWIGWWLPIAALFGIMLYYSVVIAWCINYVVFSITLAWGANPQSFFFEKFLNLSNGPFAIGGVSWPILTTTFIVWGICWSICYREINHGIEKACKIFIPILFILTLILVGWSVSLDGAKDGLIKYLIPGKQDFAILTNYKVWTAAFGQIFFTLSLGFGIMITYASYLPRKTDLVRNAYLTSIINCAYSFIAGFTVFSIVGFMAKQNGVSVFDTEAMKDIIKGGPQLAFVIYPQAINSLPFLKSIFGIIFFTMLVFAGLTSAISLIEAFTCAVRDKFSFNRKKTVTVICIIGFLGSIIYTTRAGLIIGGFLECVIVGWVLKTEKMRNYINSVSYWKIGIWWDIFLRYVSTVILLILIILAIIQEFRAPYEGYPVKAIIFFGVAPVLMSICAGIIFSLYPWKPELLQKRHAPEEDPLMV